MLPIPTSIEATQEVLCAAQILTTSKEQFCLVVSRGKKKKALSFLPAELT
jgi:hypothetical protein